MLKYKWKVSFGLIELDKHKYKKSLSTDEKSILDFSLGILERILQQINRQKLSNVSDEQILISLKKFNLNEIQNKYILQNFLELKQKLMKSYPKKRPKGKSYAQKVKKKTHDLLSKGYSREYAEAKASKEFKTDKYVPLKFVEGGSTNKR